MQLGKEKIVRLYLNFFNLRLGWLAIPIIGGMVFFLNLSHGFFEALRAGVVAGLTGMLITGIMCRIIQHFALSSLTLISSIALNFGTHFFSQRAVPATRLARLCHYFFAIPGRRP